MISPAALAFALFTAVASAGTAKVDKGHSGVMFKAHHFGAGYTWGRFNDFGGTVEVDGDTLKGMDITVKTESIDTGIEKRDKHLRSPDFFDAAKHGELTFKSTKVEAKGDGVFQVTGDLTLHGVTKAVTVDVKHTGTGKLPVMMGGGTISGWETSFPIKQSDHGMKYDGIGDEAFVHVNLEVKH
jgi:polyisoprenoid-binding protein YceI